ncbi:MAG: hypothetical protein L0H53_10125 [Candidatus Nitrosocosmicus sp.]|nr:hypothetical protein [Candidatus Nitrosocosmicus sp.]MDN5868311.1 hypothetical protein [Candidatus Nitrosocosmicus sp.]
MVITTTTISSELRRESVEFKDGARKLIHLVENGIDFSFRSNPSELAVLFYEIKQTIETIHYLSDIAHHKAILYWHYAHIVHSQFLFQKLFNT